MKIEYLGQSGLKIDYNHTKILIDPYLSNSVQEIDSPDLVRQVPIFYQPCNLIDIDWVLITHEHIDHCDPHTIPALAKASPKALFCGPLPVREKLKEWSINSKRILPLQKEELLLCDYFKVLSIPCAHPNLKFASDGFPESIGWYLYDDKVRIYSAGDTSLFDEIFSYLKDLPQIDIGILPVNEDNYFRRRRGIIGNMSIREAFEMADELRMKKVFPVHWDMFTVNSAIPEEIKIIYNSYDWDFELITNISCINF